MYVKSYKTCKHCGREMVTTRLTIHERKCLDQQADLVREKKPGRAKGTKPWNLGLTKHTDPRVMQYAITIQEQRRVARDAGIIRPVYKMSEEHRKNLSIRQSLHNTGGHCKWYDVAGQSVQGTYELMFAEAMVQQNVVWEKVKTHQHLFEYQINDRVKSYSPDFYLPEFDLYVEIKGFWWGNDKHKMELVKQQHQDKDLVVIFGLSKLQQVCENIKEYLPLEPVWSW